MHLEISARWEKYSWHRNIAANHGASGVSPVHHMHMENLYKLTWGCNLALECN